MHCSIQRLQRGSMQPCALGWVCTLKQEILDVRAVRAETVKKIQERVKRISCKHVCVQEMAEEKLLQGRLKLAPYICRMVKEP